MTPFEYDARRRQSSVSAADLQTTDSALKIHATDEAGLRKLMLEDPSRRLLVVLAAVNAGGKDGSIEERQEVLGAEHIRIERIKRPIVVTRGHDLLRTAEPLAPEPGEIVVFNRSYYEVPLHSARHDRSKVEEMCARIVRFEENWRSRASRSSRSTSTSTRTSSSAASTHASDIHTCITDLRGR